MSNNVHDYLSLCAHRGFDVWKGVLSNLEGSILFHVEQVKIIDCFALCLGINQAIESVAVGFNRS